MPPIVSTPPSAKPSPSPRQAAMTRSPRACNCRQSGVGDAAIGADDENVFHGWCSLSFQEFAGTHSLPITLSARNSSSSACE